MAADRSNADSQRLLTTVRPGHTSRAEISAAVAGEDVVADLDGLDRLHGAVSHRDRRALDEALVVVADDGEVAVLGRQELEPAVLGVVGVLVLVDEDPAERV